MSTEKFYYCTLTLTLANVPVKIEAIACSKVQAIERFKVLFEAKYDKSLTDEMVENGKIWRPKYELTEEEIYQFHTFYTKAARMLYVKKEINYCN